MRRALSAALLATAFALGACGPVNRGVESANQPVVSRTDYVFDVGSDALTQGDGQGRLDAWFGALDLAYGDKVALDDPTPYDHRAVREAVAAVLARHGMLLSDATPVTAGQIDAGKVRVVVSRASAHVPGCPNWDRPSQPEFAASGMSNYGCGVNANLAAMVANPRDLVQGEASAETDARSTVRGIKTYRELDPTGKQGLKIESTKTGGN